MMTAWANMLTCRPIHRTAPEIQHQAPAWGSWRRWAPERRHLIAHHMRATAAVDAAGSDSRPPRLADLEAVGVADVTRSSKPLVLEASEVPSLFGQLMPSVQGMLLSGALNVACKLRIPDAMGSESLSVSEIAGRINASVDEGRLQRVLRFLAAAGVVKEGGGPGGGAVYGLTAGGALLQTDIPGQPSLAPGVLHLCGKGIWESLELLPAAVAGELGDKSPFATSTGLEPFDYLEKYPGEMRVFSQWMTSVSTPEAGLVAAMLPWKDWKGKTVVDIGGGSGTVLSAVKAAEPSIRAISFDLPAAISKDGEVEGVEMVAGDMFDPATIPASDIYFMKHILHDWSDEDALRVLRSIHQAGGAGSRLILAEGIVPEPGDEDLFMGKVMYIDMIMMLIGGKERSRPEWSALLGQAGWLIDEVVNTPGPLCQLIVCSQA